MRKMLIPIVTLILIVTIPLQAMAAPCYISVVDLDANKQQFSVMFVHINYIRAILSITGGTAECSGSIQPASDCSASILVVLYRSIDGSSWTSIASWSGGAGVGETVFAGGSKTVSSGYQYKVVAYGTIRNSDNVIVESPTKTSVIKSY
jgi:hypothetical protein